MSENVAELNKPIVLHGYAALKAGDVAGYFDRMAEDVTATTASPNTTLETPILC